MGKTNTRIVTTSWDDGHPLDLKLADVLAEYGVNGTFYVPICNKEKEVMDSDSIVELARRYEIGGHTRSHIDLRRIRREFLNDEIGTARLELQDLLGSPVSMFSYPQGKHDEWVRAAVEQAGFIGARTTQEFSIEYGKDVFQMPTTLQAFPHSPWIRVRHALLIKNIRGALSFSRKGVTKTWAEIAQCFFEEMLEKGGVWHLWGHSWEIEEYNLWSDLRTVLDTVANRESVTYLTNSEVIENVTKLST
jgi:peptidoglycan/xylan/chitin deacetylase (PgdA/CDA1 family)